MSNRCPSDVISEQDLLTKMKTNSVAATATSIPSLIVANIFIGLGAAVQISFVSFLGELVPVRDRGIWIGGVFLISICTVLSPFYG